MKYHSAVLAVFKNESSFLPEWVNHYFSIVIKHTYILNTNDVVDIILIKQNYVN